MPRGTTTPDADGLRRDFAALPFADRREVARAVNRGRAVEDRKLAVFAVVTARRQQRLWRWMWLAGPLIGLTQIGVGWQGAVVAAVIATTVMGLLSRAWHGRAERAEHVNLEQVPKRHRHRVDPDARRRR